MSIVYRLLSGKVSRPNKEGVMEIHRAPYDFIPTPGEYEANKFRLRAVKEIIDDTAGRNLRPVQHEDGLPETIPAGISVNTRPVDFAENAKPLRERKFAGDICKLSVLNAIAYIGKISSEQELDAILLQEVENKPRVRKRVVEAVEQQRSVLQFQSKQGKLDIAGAKAE